MTSAGPEISEGLFRLTLDDATQGSTSSPASVSTFHVPSSVSFVLVNKSGSSSIPEKSLWHFRLGHLSR
jgi:hypothetical protein